MTSAQRRAKAIKHHVKRTGKSRRWVLATIGRMIAKKDQVDLDRYSWLW